MNSERSIRILGSPKKEQRGTLQSPSLRRAVLEENNIALDAMLDEIGDLLSNIDSLADSLEQGEKIRRKTEISFSIGVSSSGKLGILGIEAGRAGNASLTIKIELSPRKVSNTEC